MLDRATEAMPLPALRALQLERLRATVARLAERVPFYGERFAEARVGADDLRSIEDLARFPFTTKADLRANYPFGLVSVPRHELRRVHASSGTSGKPTVVGYDSHDLDVFAEVVARCLFAAGARPGMLFHNAYGYGLFTGGLGLHAGAERLGLATLPVSGGMTERQVALIEDLRPDVLACTPSYALVLADALAARGYAPEQISIRYALLGAEPWSERVRREVESRLGVRATNIYGLSEIIGPGVCNEDVDEQAGSYIWEDHFYPEIVSAETGRPLPDGEFGVLVLTSMTRTGMPLLRYWTGDITRLLPPPNATGRTMRRMDMIRGRADDMLIVRGVNVYPSQLAAALAGVEDATPHFQIVVRRDGRLDELTLRVETLRDDPAVAREVVRAVKAFVGVSVECELCAVGTLPRSEGGKLSRVVDLRGPS
jgi:phenylacetate-CoA ligase